MHIETAGRFGFGGQLAVMAALALAGCGVSDREKDEIATLTCNVMGESRNMDAAFRLKEINAAREQMGEDRFLGTDDEIKDSFKYGLCEELVKNSEAYAKITKELRQAEYEKISKGIAERSRLLRMEEDREIERKRLEAEKQKAEPSPK